MENDGCEIRAPLNAAAKIEIRFRRAVVIQSTMKPGALECPEIAIDRLESMSMLLTVAEAGSLSAAARRLNTPLTTVSRKISDLEHYLKTQLLTRSSRKMTLTDAGKSYVAACKRILEDVAEAERIAMGEYISPMGDLTITAPTIFGRVYLVPVLAAFLRIYPDINARLTLLDRVVDLGGEGIDAALRVGDLPDSALIVTRIGTIHRVFLEPCQRCRYTRSLPADGRLDRCGVRGGQGGDRHYLGLLPPCRIGFPRWNPGSTATKRRATDAAA